MTSSYIDSAFLDAAASAAASSILSALAALPSAVPTLLAMGTPAQGSQSAWVQLLPFVLVLGIFYFVILMPMKKRQQKVQTFLSALKVGDNVVTSGGIYGTITKLNEQSVQLQIANQVRVELSRNAVVGYQGQEPVTPENR